MAWCCCCCYFYCSSLVAISDSPCRLQSSGRVQRWPDSKPADNPTDALPECLSACSKERGCRVNGERAGNAGVFSLSSANVCVCVSSCVAQMQWRATAGDDSTPSSLLRLIDRPRTHAGQPIDGREAGNDGQACFGGAVVKIFPLCVCGGCLGNGGGRRRRLEALKKVFFAQSSSSASSSSHTPKHTTYSPCPSPTTHTRTRIHNETAASASQRHNGGPFQLQPEQPQASGASGPSTAARGPVPKQSAARARRRPGLAAAAAAAAAAARAAVQRCVLLGDPPCLDILVDGWIDRSIDRSRQAGLAQQQQWRRASDRLRGTHTHAKAAASHPSIPYHHTHSPPPPTPNT
jgi:hypothetical protein